jgi:hypothetical protein
MSSSFASRGLAICVILMTCSQSAAFGAQTGLTQYTDPQARFVFDYPATMSVQASDPDAVLITHPKASLRIAVFIEKRENKGKDAESQIQAFKVKLKEEVKDFNILEEGKVPGISGPQGYIVCSFKNAKGLQVVHLVQYYFASDRILRMTIQDRPEGFKNLEKLIKVIHHSLRILNPGLK